jgi:transcriptional regulator with XRE-family HTH domain
LEKTLAFVKHHRLSQNKTQEEVAGAANISRSTLSLLEKGETITVPTLIQVLRVLDLLYIMEVFKIKEQISPIELISEKRQRAKVK